MVDAYWNETSNNDSMYKEVLLDIYGPEKVQLDQVDQYRGMQILEMALKHAAKTKSQSERKYWLQDSSKYGTNVYRVTDVECLDCWYGFIYTANESGHVLRERLTPELTGLEVVFPPLTNGYLDYELNPGHDMIIILRRTNGSCQFGWRS